MELVSNLLQFIVTLLGFSLSGIWYLKSRKQTYFLLTCFYGCFALGSLYWTLYLLLFSETPQVFYVSEFGWMASVIFLYILQYALSSAEERGFATRKALIALLVGVPLCVFYCTFGDILSNLLWCGMMIVVSYHAIRGLAYARTQAGAARDMRYFHIGVLCYVAAEYALWTSGCFWPGDSISSPYCWFYLRSAARYRKGGGGMTYIENIFICMASPLLIAALCMGKRQTKFFLFCLAGIGACLLSAYINTFLAALYGADTFGATAEIAPVVEEVMKLLPLLFYLLVFEPKAEQIKIAAVITALSFATFENVCYLIQNGAGHFSFIFFRGIGTGAMHVICGAIVGGGLAYVWRRTWLKIAGTCGLLGAAITFHAIYNLLIAYGGAAQYIAYLLPVLILTVGKLLARRLTP